MSESINTALTNIAAAVAVIGVQRENHEPQLVTLTFEARRDAKGVNIAAIELTTKPVKPK